MVTHTSMCYATGKMKHLHLQFILASIALGLSGVFLFGALWDIHAVNVADWAPIRVYASAMLSSLTGSTLLVFGLTGIRAEMNGTPHP